MQAITLMVLAVVSAGPDALFDDLALEEQKRVEAHSAKAAPEAAGPVATAAAVEPATEAAPTEVKAPPVASTIETPAVGQSIALPIEPARRVSRARPWRVQVALGVEHARDDSLGWFGDPAGPALHIRLERSLERWVDGLSIYAAGNFGSRGRNDDTAALSLIAAEGELGATVQWPGDGFWGWIFPYGRAGFSAAYVQINAGSDLEGSAVMPGFGARLGSRFHFGSVTNKRRVSFFGFAEGGYALRLPRTAKLERPDPDEENPILSGPSVRLGRINLSAPEWRMGIGLAF